ncbi:MAG: hypothetical protein PF436_08540 [Prolixibacteraceae bacterium]|nr:hypothetical protein [Prolixibacteraceae bacterium]
MENALLERIDKAAIRLAAKLKGLDIETLSVSEYNRKYLGNYISHLQFYMTVYTQLMAKAVRALKHPIEESLFVDYGGGCGLLSMLAVETGFKEVIYNDIYDVSTADAEVIGQYLGLMASSYVCSDIDKLVAFLNIKNKQPDVLCSMDVLEHIYNPKDWFAKAGEINADFSIVFLTSANPANPFVKKRLKKLHAKAEYSGEQKTEGWKERDSVKPFVELRKDIISQFAPGLGDSEVAMLAKHTRGQKVGDIENAVSHYFKTGVSPVLINHPTNTCDPFTGNWSENLLDLKEFRSGLSALGYNVRFENSYYSYSENQKLNMVKALLNLIIWSLGRRFLIFSPSVTVIAYK